MNATNLKDTLTTYAAIAFGLAVAVLGLPTAIQAIAPTAVFVMPPIVNVISGIIIAVSIVITQALTGKNPDGSTKTPTQIVSQNTQAAVTKDAPVTAETVKTMGTTAIANVVETSK